jgi:hypothetical protein
VPHLVEEFVRDARIIGSFRRGHSVPLMPRQ